MSAVTLTALHLRQMNIELHMNHKILKGNEGMSEAQCSPDDSQVDVHQAHHRMGGIVV